MRRCTPAGFALAVALAVWAQRAAAQETPPAVTTQQRGGTYVAPPATVDPVYVPRGPDAPALPAQTAALSLQLALDLPLRSGGSANAGRGTQGSTAISPTVQARVRWTPLAQSYWFSQFVFYRYLRRDLQQSWHPDFSYAFGYEDWHPGTWSFSYANYTGTRWQPRPGSSRFNFSEGEWTLAYQLALGPSLESLLLAGDGDAAGCRGALGLTPRYVEFATGGDRHFKLSASLQCRYTRPEGWFAEATLYAWPRRSQQQPWDPDFTYGFGYQDPGPGHAGVRYTNYSGNRFPGRPRGPGEGTLRSGSVTLSWDFQW